MTTTHTEKAYAKINLYLDVNNKREDGYHDIVSVMQNVSLFDLVRITVNESDDMSISVVCDDPSIPQGEENIAYKAAKLFLEKLQKKAEISVEIEKNIPSAAGLAGGSADAAAVLRGLNILFDEPFTMDELCAWGAKIGADVPFCVLEGAYVAEGIGEVLEKCTGLDSKKMLLVARAGEGVSTPVAYKELDSLYGDFAAKKDDVTRIKKLLDALSETNYADAYGAMYNVFEDVVLPKHSMAARIKEEMYASGAEFAMMSGSGPSVFAIFPDNVFALNALYRLKELGAVAHLCNPL